MGYIEDIQRQKMNEQKAKAFDKMQLDSHITKVADEAHTVGIDDGLAAALRRLQSQRDGIVVNPQAQVSSEEVARARQMFGEGADMQDIEKMRQLDSLGGSIGAAPDGGLAQQQIKGY